MPLKLNVGLSRKIGEPNFSSRGASANFEVEVESTLVGEPDQLREKIRHLFGLAKVAIEEELHGNDGQDQNGYGNNRYDGNTSPRPRNGRPATASQIRTIFGIASRQRLDLPAELRSRFGVDRPEDLSIGDASEMIDMIKPAVEGGNGGRR
jgi:hypothetical protein